jgi:AcrR family transcriptional regulator
MENDDDLWPPYGPGAAFRQAARQQGAQRARGRTEPGRAWPDPDRGGRVDRGEGPGRGRARGHAEYRDRERRNATLSRAQIVDAAIAIADAEGAEAVSMRRIAQVLQAGAMSLYWHLAGKEHLLELMLDALMADVDVPEPTGDWRADLQVQARSTRAVLRRHAWVMDFIGAQPPMGPNTLRNIDKSIAALDGIEAGIAAKMNILQAVNTYVSGAVLRELQEIRAQREQDQFGRYVDMHEMLEVWRQKLALTGRFQHFLSLITDQIDPDALDTQDERFEFGLDCLLDGIAARLGS